MQMLKRAKLYGSMVRHALSLPKTGKISIDNFIDVMVGVVVLFYLAADLIPQAQTAGDTLNASGVPLGGLFAAGGVIFIIIMAFMLRRIVKDVKK